MVVNYYSQYGKENSGHNLIHIEMFDGVENLSGIINPSNDLA